MKNACRIIGVLDNGVDGLTPYALKLIKAADVVIGGSRTLALFKNEFSTRAKQHNLTGQLTQVPEWVKQALDNEQQVVVLATGDPLCHGIAKYLIGKLGIENCEVVANVSTIQLACARLGIAWQDIKICSVHSHDAGEWLRGAEPSHGLYGLLQQLKQHQTIAVFTSPENSPARIARMLQIENMASDFNMSVVSDIFQDTESVIETLGIDKATEKNFSDLNIVILQKIEKVEASVLFGLEDSSFHQRKPEKGLITKREVRVASLASMQLRRDSIVWDIGAGSGSVGLEAARLCSDGHVYAIEKNEADFANALKNQQDMKITNYTLLHSKAPQGLENWMDPDAIFIGGSGGELIELIKLSLKRLRTNGCLVMNFVTLENMASATQALKELNAEWSFTQISVSRSQPILHMHRLAAENPVWIVTASKQE
ncbi:MAG TPA: precorrin-6y C5,15-methyltransferase (decarboxylating) subunit CbiE [Gammaproteobacteria bacterium]|nr:precorrin-6y C5,15-methyltransferase (decarboxylating) subunit CbiE [Gammaproteobacteria bacterium]